MATVRRIIELALRRTGEFTKHEPIEGPDLAEGLPSFQSMIDSWVTGGLLGAVVDELVDGDSEAEENRRYSSTENITITLPMTIDDGCIRAPRDGAFVILALGSPYQIYIYSAIIADWVSLTDLTLSSEAPLSGFGADGLAAALAVYMGGDLTDDTRRQAINFRAALASRWGEVRRIEAGVYY